MDIEELRAYCLSFSPEVEEKFPFRQFKAAQNVLAFYISGLTHVTLKCQKEKIDELIAQYDYIDHPYNGNAKYWIGIDAHRADARLLKKLIKDSFSIIVDKYKKAGRQTK